MTDKMQPRPNLKLGNHTNLTIQEARVSYMAASFVLRYTPMPICEYLNVPFIWNALTGCILYVYCPIKYIFRECA